MARFDTWGSYLYPEPNARTLRNLPGIRDRQELAAFELIVVGARGRQLEADPALVTRTFDGAHVRAIHRHLFQDVYEWAGEYRTVGMAKGVFSGDEPKRFADVGNGEVRDYLEDVKRGVSETDWGALSQADFAQKGAEIFAALNEAHPFREGNGRTTKVFMGQVADLSPYQFDFASVTPELWNLASELSRPEQGRYAVNPAPMARIFAAISTPRPEPVEDHIPEEPRPIAVEIPSANPGVGRQGSTRLEDLAHRMNQMDRDTQAPGGLEQSAPDSLSARSQQISPPTPNAGGPQL